MIFIRRMQWRPCNPDFPYRRRPGALAGTGRRRDRHAIAADCTAIYADMGTDPFGGQNLARIASLASHSVFDDTAAIQAMAMMPILTSSARAGHANDATIRLRI